MIIDAHLHTSGRETCDEVLRTLDEAGVDMAFLLAPFLTDPYTLEDAASLKKANRYLSQLVEGHRGRLVGSAVVNRFIHMRRRILTRRQGYPGYGVSKWFRRVGSV